MTFISSINIVTYFENVILNKKLELLTFAQKYINY